MRILILGLNYLPESVSIGPYTAGLAEYLLQRGHEVQIVTGFPMMPRWRIWDGYRDEWWRRELINSVPVLRTYLYVPEEPRRSVSRVLYDMSFSLSALAGALAAGNCDLVMAVSPPLQIGVTGWVVSRVRGVPLFFHVQDLVPDAAVATGMLSETGAWVRLARWLERFIYHRAQGIGVICEGFKQNLESKGVNSSKISLLPNSIDLEFIRPGQRDNGFRRQIGISPADFLVMYSGSIAQKQGLEVLVDTAALLPAGNKVKFVIIGDGPPLTQLKERANHLRLSNVLFLPLQPREILSEQLNAADALVITQRRTITDVAFPGKLLYYAAAARPIVAAVNPSSETGRFITEHKIGIVVPPEQPDALAEAILRLSENGAGDLGRNGRKVAEACFDRRVVLPRFAECLEQLAVR